MKKYTTAQRLNQIMEMRNISQADILRLVVPYCKKYLVKLGSNDLSQYVAGKVKPRQNKLFVLSKALNVSEAWLMGFDLPMERDEPAEPPSPADTYADMLKDEQIRRLLDLLKGKDAATIKQAVAVVEALITAK